MSYMRHLMNLVESRFDDFDDEEDFGKPEIKMVTLPAGTVVYHGTGSYFREKLEHLDPPGWVSRSFRVAQNFVHWNDHGPKAKSRVIEYVLTRDINLVRIDSKRALDQIVEFYGLDEYSTREMAEGFCAADRSWDGWIIPDNYTEGDDIMLCDTSLLKYQKSHRVPDA